MAQRVCFYRPVSILCISKRKSHTNKYVPSSRAVRFHKNCKNNSFFIICGINEIDIIRCDVLYLHITNWLGIVCLYVKSGFIIFLAKIESLQLFAWNEKATMIYDWFIFFLVLCALECLDND